MGALLIRTAKHKKIFLILAVMTLTSTLLVGFLLFRLGIRSGLIWLIPLILQSALLIWSIILFRKNRWLAVFGFIVLMIALGVMINLPDYYEYKKRHVNAASSLNADVSFPMLGRVRVEIYSSLRVPGSRPFLTFQKSNGPVKQFAFRLGQEYSSDVLKEYRFPARLKVASLEGVNTPLIVAVVGLSGGSDSTFETMIIGESNGGLRDLLPDHPTTNIEDAVCIGLFGKAVSPQILVAKFLWDAGEAHPEPHRYIVKQYLWNGLVFSKKSEVTTKNKHSDGLEALEELGYSCNEDITETLAPDVR